MEVDKVKNRATYFQKLSSTVTRDVLHEIEDHSESHSLITPIKFFDGDIVAVHGLSGHFFKTWAHDATFWLSDLLPYAFPKARIFSYSYDSRFFTRYKGNLEGFAQSMLEQLKNKRDTSNRQDKAVLFICHSLGGLVVKKAMVVANHDSRYREILESTKVITFMGTPHRGSDYPKVVRNIAKITSPGSMVFSLLTGFRDKLLRDLESHSPSLTELSDSFKELTKNIRIVSFYETQPPKLSNRLVVERDSANIGLLEEDSNLLSRDHMGMCKVDSNDETCQHFCTILAPIQRQLEKLDVCSGQSLGSKQNIDLPTPDVNEEQFQDREDELGRLKKLASDYTDTRSPLLLLLCGSPGMGKTELALHFLKWLQPKYPIQFILDPESEESLCNSFCRVAERLRITTTNEPGPLASACEPTPPIDVTVRHVRHELSSTREPWVLLFDNYIPTFEIREYFPNNNRGIILVCAAEEQQSRSLIGAQVGCTIRVESMPKQHLVTLFWSKVKATPDYKSPDGKVSDAVDALIHTLNCHTLSVRLAGRFFGVVKGGYVTIEGLQDFITAINQQPGSGYDGNFNENAWKPWQLLISKLENRHDEVVRAAMEYLRLRAFFSHEHLSTSKLFRNVAEQRCHSAWVEHDHLPTFLGHRQGYVENLEQAERRLSDYGLVDIGGEQDDRGTRMPGIFQLYARRLLWDAASGQQSHDWCAALCLLGESINRSFDYEAVSFRKALVPHIDTCFKVYENSTDETLRKIDLRTAGNIFLNFAAAYTEVGRFDRAGELQRKALDHLIKHLGPKDDLTLTAKGEFASNLDLRDEATEALKLREEVYEQRGEVYNRNRNDPIAGRKYVSAAALTAISYARLPEQKHEALRLRRVVIELTKKANDSWTDEERPGNLALLKAKRELATSFVEMGRNMESLRLREEIVKSLGQKKDVFTLNARRELLTSLSSARQFVRAIDLGNSIVEDSTSLLGSDHPDTWLARSVLATLRSYMGQGEDAKKELQMVVTTFRDIWGATHSNTIRAQVELARVQLALKEGEDELEAMNTFRQISELYEVRYGPKSYQKLTNDMEMAIVLQRRRSPVALTNMKYIVSGLESTLPADDSALIFARLQLAGCFAQFGDLKAAASGYELILSVFGADKLPTARYLKAKLRLASTYFKLAESKPRTEGSDLEAYYSSSQHIPSTVHDDFESASENLSKSALISQIFRAGIRKLKPKASVETIVPESDPGPVYKDYDRAELKQKALELQQEVVQSTGGIEHGLSDQLAAEACFGLAVSYAQENRFGEAVDLQKAVVSFFVQSFGKDSPETHQHQGMLNSWKMLCNE